MPPGPGFCALLRLLACLRRCQSHPASRSLRPSPSCRGTRSSPCRRRYWHPQRSWPVCPVGMVGVGYRPHCAVHYSFQKGGTRQPRLTSADAPTLASSDEFPMKFVSSKLVERAGILHQGPGPNSPSRSPRSSSTRPSSSACSNVVLAPAIPSHRRPATRSADAL